MATYKEGDRVLLGKEEPEYQEKGTILEDEGDGMYMVEVDERVDARDDRLRECHEDNMEPLRERSDVIVFPLLPLWRSWVMVTIRRGTHSDMFGATQERFVEIKLSTLTGNLRIARRYANNVRWGINIYREN